ncbi:Cna B-type domain-containing protein [Solobacterium moorei]|uniref:Cna B-type domain-containing protein n=1 Tax=Solobacterium moorei TaxID=102148 RepID=UPI0023F49188|nr:Cna B-type domain-containing protein [Solobacterium moorei]
MFAIKADNTLDNIELSAENIEQIYNKVKDWPITGVALTFHAGLVRPVMRTGVSIPNTAISSGVPITGKNLFVVGEISLFTYKDGAAILKTDAKTGQGIKDAEFKLQEKDAGGNWVDTDSQFMKDTITIVGENGGNKIDDRLYTGTNGILNIRGLVNNKTYRLVETKAPEGYDNSTLAVSKEFEISFTDKNLSGDNKDLTLTNKKSEYKVTYKVVKNPDGDEIPVGSPNAPEDSNVYNLHSTVDVKPDLTMQGYIFAGWHTENGQPVDVKDSDGSFTMPGANVELVGYWINNTTQVSGEKTWNDTNNQDGKRPNKITVNLLADGALVQSQEVMPDATEKWLYSFRNLAKYNAQGQEIKYTVTEDAVAGYTAEINNFDIKNSYTPEKVNISVTKVWIGKKADSVTVNLYADGVKIDSKQLTAADQWQYTFTNLDKYNNGNEIQYTVKEELLANYDSAITGDMANGFKITNTNTEKISIPVEKKWVGPVAASATVKLLADGVEKETVTLNAAGNWKHTFNNLPKYDATDGHEIEYKVQEEAIANYTTAISGTATTGFTITNTITGKVSIPVTKVWIGKEADSVTVNLYADGIDTGQRAVLDSTNRWQYTFTNLDEYKNGNKIQYTVKEETLANYDSAITGDMANGFKITNTNTEKISIPVEKKWVGPVAASATVKLLADGVEKETVTLNAAGNWKHTFNNLPKYDATDGHEIVYTIDEENVTGYSTKIIGDAKTGFTITNTKNTPKTYDNTNIGMFMILMVASLVILGVDIVIKKRYSSI